MAPQLWPIRMTGASGAERVGQRREFVEMALKGERLDFNALREAGPALVVE